MDENIDPKYYPAMYGQAGDFNSIRFQLDSTDELDDLRAELLGLEYDEETGEYQKSAHKMPMMNEVGANAVLSTLRPRSNKMFSLSNHDQDDIDARCRRYIDNLSIMLVRHQDTYGIKSYSIMDNVIDLCDDMFRATILKSLKGWEGEGIRSQQSVSEVRQTVTSKQDKPGFFQNLPIGLRKRN